MKTGQTLTIAKLGSSVTIAYASSYYLPAILAKGMAQSLGLGVSTVFLAFSAALVVSALLGPFAGRRLLKYSLLRSVSPLFSARVASLAHPLGALLFLAMGVPAGLVFTILHGAGNGVMTIANGTLPLIFFGPAGYGVRQGVLMMPARFAQALAPFFVGFAIEHWGASAWWFSMRRRSTS